MVSGFLISPKLHERILSGDAMPMRIWSNVSWRAIGLAKLVSSFIGFFPRSPPEGGRGGFSLFGGDGGRSGVVLGLDRVELNRQSEAAHFLDQHVEAFGDPSLERVVTLDDRLVDLGPADHVVRLDGQHFLQ